MPLLQSFVVLLIVASFYIVPSVGEKFALRAEPFDPFNPFYGEYVMLQYPDLKPRDNIKEGTIYFTLKTAKDGYAVIDQIDNESFFGGIKGSYWGDRIVAPQLEQFYVEQGKGPELEKARDLQVTIYVSPWGSIRPMDIEKREE